MVSAAGDALAASIVQSTAKETAMERMMAEEVLAAMRRLPGYGSIERLAGTRRLGGLTNRVYRVGLDAGPAVLRIPGEGTEAYIDRVAEAVNAAAAARAGVAPDVLEVVPAHGLMLTRHVEGRTMTPELFATTPGAPGRAAAALRQLHTSGERFAARFELFAMIDGYLAVLADLGAALPDGYHGAVARAQTARAALDADPAPLAPCHCDPLCENFLDTGARMWIVDWEYSGMNDPLWDLGDLSVEAALAPDAEEELLCSSFDAPPTAAQRGRVVVYKAMCDLLWTLWGLIQHANDNPAEDFWAYSTTRFERCRRLMGTGEFERHLAAVAAA
jgi:thiamine kinase-like enzyme